MVKLKPYISKYSYKISPITKIVLLTLLIVAGKDTFAQKHLKEAIPFQNTIRIRLSDSTYVVTGVTNKKYKEPLNNRTIYHWLSKDTILQAQGTYFGKLLHGKYREFYSNRQPKVEGSFIMGRKTNVWKYWDRNGTLRKINRWNNGKQRGRFRVYNEEGKLVQKGRMRNGEIIQGSFLLEAISKLKHWKVHRNQNNSDENAQKDNNKRFQN